MRLNILSLPQEEFHGFTDLDVSAASERAEILRDEGDLLKHDIAEARGAYKVGGNQSFLRRGNFFLVLGIEDLEGIPAPPVPLPGLVSFSS